MYPQLIYVHLGIFIGAFASFPHSVHTGGKDKDMNRVDTTGAPCTTEQVDKLFSEIKILPDHAKFKRFFKPDCQRNKLVFLPHMQGCLGALRYLEQRIRRKKGDEKIEEPSKWIVCTHKTCTDLPVFRRCGSNEPNKTNPRTFKNGCHQCTASCKRVVSGGRRYVRLDMNKCHDPERRRKPRPRPSTTTQPPNVTQYGPKTPINESQRPLKSLLRSPLKTTATTTVNNCEQAEKAPIQESPKAQQCVTKRLRYNHMDCSLIVNVTSETGPPTLPPWIPKGDR